MTSRCALIDWDVVLYSVGFASEERYYLVGDQRFESAKEANEFIDDSEELVKELVRENVDPMVWKGNANSTIEKIMDGAGCDTCKIYLTGPGNFREKVVTDYKAHRKDVSKPLMFKEMREWLIERHGAIVVEGIEADDAMATEGYQNQDSTVICTTDKDLKMVPGWHFNWNKDVEPRQVQDPEGYRWFFTQLLMGDSADNIHGLYRVGQKTAEKLLADCITAQEMYEACLDEYEARDRTMMELWFNGDLLWMQRNGRGCYWYEHLSVVTQRQHGEHDET